VPVEFERLAGAARDRARRGGVRTIYYFASAQGTLYLLDIYAKNRQSDLTPDDKKELKRIVEGLR
jgi:hypothetical protein